MYFVNSTHIPQQGSALCSFVFYDRSYKILTWLKTCLCILETYRQTKFSEVRLSSVVFGFVRLKKPFKKNHIFFYNVVQANF